MTKITHDHLIKKGRAWLVKSKPGNCIMPTCGFTLSEVVSGRETDDILGFGSGRSIMIECKMSHADFLADRRKLSRKYPRLGRGNWRFYLCPEGIILEEELPPGWGLLWLVGGAIVMKRRALVRDCDSGMEISALCSVVRRLMGSKKHFSTREE